MSQEKVNSNNKTNSNRYQKKPTKNTMMNCITNIAWKDMFFPEKNSSGTDKYIVHMPNTKENSRKIGEIIEQIKPKNPSHSDKINSLCYSLSLFSEHWNVLHLKKIQT